MREATWTSPKPFAKGTTRTVKLENGTRLDEVFSAWEPNRRIAFSVVAVNRSWLSGFTEVYEVTPLSAGRCKLRWTLAMSFSGRLAVIEPIVGRLTPLNQTRLLRKLERATLERRSPAQARQRRPHEIRESAFDSEVSGKVLQPRETRCWRAQSPQRGSCRSDATGSGSVGALAVSFTRHS